MNIDLNNCFPEPENGAKRGPLPKQQEFLDNLLNPKGPKYVAYVGGIGSGKTMIGCIAMLTMAVVHPGDYLIGRQHFPALRDTTLKTFLEITPPELIAEHRVADGIVKVRNVNGGTSNIFFRHLEEPDKLRSLNLSGFYIDEATEVSENAFMLLQGRLRGKGLRKGFLTSNPKGHDWVWKWFVNKRHLLGHGADKHYYLIKAPSTENIHLPEGYVETLMSAWSEDQIKREIYGDFDTFQGQIFTEFNRATHVVKPFKIPDSWERIVGIDHGYRNPTAFIWGAVDYDGDIYIYREFYQKEWLIEEICKGKGKEPGVTQLTKGEKLQYAKIDPSTQSVRGQKGVSDFDTYLEHLPKDFPLSPANNAVRPGIDRVKSYLKVDEKRNKPRIYIFDTCHNLIEEIAQYRWKEQSHHLADKANIKEEPVKRKDHAVDALRYMIMGLPEEPKNHDEIYDTIEYNSLEGSLHREMLKWKKKLPKNTDPWSES